jgi:hypothetical protein
VVVKGTVFACFQACLELMDDWDGFTVGGIHYMGLHSCRGGWKDCHHVHALGWRKHVIRC